MTSLLRATALLSSGSIISILVGLVSAKISALLLGPAGVGFMGLLQSLLGLAVLIAGLGINTGLVRAGAAALARGDQPQVAALRRGAWLLTATLGGVAMLVLILLRAPIAQWMLGSASHGDSVIMMAGALLFSLAAAIQTAILNAYHRVKALAQVAVLTSVLGTACAIAVIVIWRAAAIPVAVLATAVVSWGVSGYFLRREQDAALPQPTVPSLREAMRGLLRFGGPYTLSMLVGTGVQLTLPVLVLNRLGPENVGFYRAAVAISVSYLGFLLTAMAQDYYPRVAAAEDRPPALVALINQQHRLVMLLGVPMILGVLALVPYLVPLIYSPKFVPAVAVLEWQLIGDLFKFSSWTMAYVILARSGSITFFFTELIGGASLLLTTWSGMALFGLAGIGIGFLVSYIIYYWVVWIVVRRQVGLVWSRDNKLMLLAAAGAALVIRALPAMGLEDWRTPFALTLAVGAGLASLYSLRRELGRRQDVPGLG